MVHTVSCGKKPGIQALATTSDDLCPGHSKSCVYRDYEYASWNAVADCRN